MSTSTVSSIPRRLEGFFVKPGSGVAALLVIFIVAMAVTAPSFISPGNFDNIANQMVFVLLLTLGMTIVLIVRGIDLSVGSVMGLSAGVCAFLITQGLIFPLSLLAGIGCGVFCGLLNALMITKLGLPDFVATLAMMGVARGVLFLWTEGTPFTRYMTPEYALVGGQEKLWDFVGVPIVVAAVFCIVISLVLRKSVLGRHLYATGGSPEAARLSGIPVNRVKTYAYLVSGGFAGIAGVILAGRATNVAPTMGNGYEILAITAAIIGGAALTGGRGRMIGAVLGALTITLTSNAMNIIGVSSVWQQFVTGIILLLAVLLDRLTSIFKQRQNNAALERAPREQPVSSVQSTT
ncbi:ribose transport system permease protein [Arthrobacter pigmenti]|uniref:Ribose transport system permease protein n=1 Tax=Arthrobacter pigmenti TaxID=271432 RepID=A0A846RMH8_9MICC|nr:ABC transporter permease [Arthrobacter pigmenti]NJC21514.1 ribose transport system permease protein [Arthrobacter pigmenti]